MSDSLSNQSWTTLRDAFIALDASKVKSHHDIGPCLSLVRLRDLARYPQFVSTTDARHFASCHKCFHRMNTMQSELKANAIDNFEDSLSEIKSNFSRFATAERLARNLFVRLHAHRGEPDPIPNWEIHEPVLALRHHHCPGDEEDARSIVTMTMSAIGSALCDATTSFARNLDAAWPIAVLLTNVGVEAATHHDARLATRFAGHYADVIAVAPTPIGSMLTYNLHALLSRPRTATLARDIACRVSAHQRPATDAILRILIAIDCGGLPERSSLGATDLLGVNAWVGQLRDAILDSRDVGPALQIFRQNLCTSMKALLESDDITEQLKQLLATRYYVASAVTLLQEGAEISHHLGDLARIVVQAAQSADHQYFVATETIAAMGPNTSVARVMSDFLDVPDDDMRRALFMYFVDALEESAPLGASHFVSHGGLWTFEAERDAPVAIFGSRAAAMAQGDPEIAHLIQWSQLHLVRRKIGVASERA